MAASEAIAAAGWTPDKVNIFNRLEYVTHDQAERWRRLESEHAECKGKLAMAAAADHEHAKYSATLRLEIKDLESKRARAGRIEEAANTLRDRAMVVRDLWYASKLPARISLDIGKLSKAISDFNELGSLGEGEVE